MSDALRALDRSFAAQPHVVGGGAPPPLRTARQALVKFLAAFDGQPAVGPLLLGLASLLKAQAAAADGKAQALVVDRAAVLNGGDAFVAKAVPLLGECGVRPVAEGGGGAAAEEGRADELALRVQDGSWTLGELAALASYVERKGKSGGLGARASGRVDADLSGCAYEANSSARSRSSSVRRPSPSTSSRSKCNAASASASSDSTDASRDSSDPLAASSVSFSRRAASSASASSLADASWRRRAAAHAEHASIATDMVS